MAKRDIVPYEDRIRWFAEARFGMFIHWGVYSLLARGEWVMNRERTPFAEYRPLAERFSPTRYDPNEWAKLARQAGMRYMVLTTRHHDGFCLWDSKLSDFTAQKTGAKRDLVAEYAAACRKHGLKVGFYYSLKDWGHPDWLALQEGRMTDHKRFLSYIHGQVRELCTNYGKVDLLWYDGPGPYDAAGWESKRLNAMARRLQPHIVINDRSRLPEDFSTVEQHLSHVQAGRPWEFCLTMNENWGYAKRSPYKSTQQIIDTLTLVVARGGNLLLNVGPKPDGTIPAESVKRLKEVGDWMKVNSESIYGCTSHPLQWTNYGRVTTKGNALYIHMSKSWPGKEFVTAGLKNKVRSAQLLGTKRRLKTRTSDVRMWISGLPDKPPHRHGSVIKITTQGKPEATPYPQ
ncbi:MAG: alpha-L-fucosidase [Planctomycetes bacterium]|nr:alpha-L-fucosidase [Planctomycetota bacterium]